MKSPAPSPQVVFVQIVERPARKLVLRRGKRATNYFEYCEEVDGQVWEQLGQIKQAIHEPMGLWLPRNMRRSGTSTYAQGVEVPVDFAAPVPEGFDLIDLPPCRLMVFQGQPFKDDDFMDAIASLWDVMKTYRPESFGYQWADADAPRFQLEPVGYRGYIEGRPVRRLADASSPAPSTAKRPRSRKA